jgi:hypothetical protein
MIVDMSRAAFLEALAQARPGAWIMYHVGDLFIDRSKDRKLNALAHSVYEKYEQGWLDPVRRRLGPHMYEYYAVKRRGKNVDYAGRPRQE